MRPLSIALLLLTWLATGCGESKPPVSTPPEWSLGPSFAGLRMTESGPHYAAYGPCVETDPGSGCTNPLTVFEVTKLEEASDCPDPADYDKVVRGVPASGYRYSEAIFTGSTVIWIVAEQDPDLLGPAVRALRRGGERGPAARLPAPTADNVCPRPG